MTTRPIRVITFDLDDTLWEAAPVLQQAEKAVYSWLEQHTPEVSQRFTPEALMQWRWRIFKETPKFSHQISKLRLEAMRQIFEYVGYEQDTAVKLSHECFSTFIKARNDVTLFKAVAPMLSQLKQHYILGSLTNGNADISQTPLREWFDFSFKAEEVSAAKPAPDLFLAAQKAASCQPHEMIHVGDHIEHDVLGALQAGCHTLWFNPDKHAPPDDYQASMQVHTLTDVVYTISQFEQSLSRN